ncbi:hypothetical protein, partial [Stutzerimonas kunmingensis]|uniref:hypothetical protein n=1 Tax=Stutzerimonas kunmingensis TaxID=1211807 RepID=UPI0028B0598B
AGGIGVFHQVREVFFRPSLGKRPPNDLAAGWHLLRRRPGAALAIIGRCTDNRPDVSVRGVLHDR